MSDDTDARSLIGCPAAEKIKQLEKLAYNDLEWTSLYRDPTSDELWRKSRRWPAAHGSGPPRLEPITAERALLEFDIIEGDLETR